MDVNYQDEQFRHKNRNGFIQMLFAALDKDQSRSKGENYVFLERITGLHENQLRKIVTSKDVSTVSVDDLSLLAVLLSAELARRRGKSWKWKDNKEKEKKQK